MRILLPLDDIENALQSLPGWRRDGAELTKTYRFASYLGGIRFVSDLGKQADEADHHPDLYVGWKKVVVKLATHSAGGITAMDIQMAEKAESCFRNIDDQP